MTSEDALCVMTSAPKMAAVVAELRFEGGEERVRVPVDSSISSLIAAVQQLNTVTSRLLSELVEREKAPGDIQGTSDVTMAGLSA